MSAKWRSEYSAFMILMCAVSSICEENSVLASIPSSWQSCSHHCRHLPTCRSFKKGPKSSLCTLELFILCFFQSTRSNIPKTNNLLHFCIQLRTSLTCALPFCSIFRSFLPANWHGILRKTLKESCEWMWRNPRRLKAKQRGKFTPIMENNNSNKKQTNKKTQKNTGDINGF